MEVNSSEPYSPDDSGHLVSGIEVMVGFLFFLTIVTLISYCVTLCRAHSMPGVLPYHHHQIGLPPRAAAAGPGLDQAALEAFPKLIYSKANVISNTDLHDTTDTGRGINVIYSTSLSCSVCLADYDDSDTIRILPVCAHMFHLQCIDSWLWLNPTCPLCRKLPSAPTSPELGMDSV